MNYWQSAISTKLNLEGTSRLIIIDTTGILFSDDFNNYLQSRNIIFKYSSKLSELLEISGNPVVKIIITPLRDVPYSLTSHFDIKFLDYSDFPFNGDNNVIMKLGYSDLYSLLSYLNLINPHISISSNNIETILTESRKLQSANYILNLKNEIELILSDPSDLNKVLQLGYKWGELIYHSIKQSDNSFLDFIPAIDSYSNQFYRSVNYSNLFYESTQVPKSVDKIIPYLKNNNHNKTALICFDCMGVSEWFLLKEYLSKSGFKFKENYLFSLIPSITSISRTAIFYGTYKELYTLATINEPKVFKTHFPGNHYKHFTEKDELTPDKLLGIELVSVIFSFFDELSHSAHFSSGTFTKESYFNSVNDYLKNSDVLSKIQCLVNEGFNVYFCSDHGSVIAKGNGKRIEKYIQEKFAKRSCLIPKTNIEEFKEYEQFEIPFIDDKLLLLPDNRDMFDIKNKIGISHGGITLEETIVPFIEVITQ